MNSLRYSRYSEMTDQELQHQIEAHLAVMRYATERALELMAEKRRREEGYERDSRSEGEGITVTA
jgi:hypothetical protein